MSKNKPEDLAPCLSTVLVKKKVALELATKVQVSSADVVGIQSAEIERRLRVANKDTKKEFGEATTALGILQEKSRAERNRIARKACKAGADSAVSGLNKLGLKTRWSVESVETDQDDVNGLEFLITIKQDRRAGGVGAGFTGLSVYMKASKDAKLKKAEQVESTAAKKVGELRTTLDKISNSLGNLPIVERQLKARLSKASLEQTDEGKELVRQMDASLGDITELLEFADL